MSKNQSAPALNPAPPENDREWPSLRWEPCEAYPTEASRNSEVLIGTHLLMRSVRTQLDALQQALGSKDQAGAVRAMSEIEARLRDLEEDLATCPAVLRDQRRWRLFGRLEPLMKEDGQWGVLSTEQQDSLLEVAERVLAAVQLPVGAPT